MAGDVWGRFAVPVGASMDREKEREREREREGGRERE
jgi:hypothetical protein